MTPATNSGAPGAPGGDVSFITYPLQMYCPNREQDCDSESENQDETVGISSLVHGRMAYWRPGAVRVGGVKVRREPKAIWEKKLLAA